ncbi:predicted protein [Streptomyces sp. AA4]|nr:predicted protein [Streptomyces sp. AA4]
MTPSPRCPVRAGCRRRSRTAGRQAESGTELALPCPGRPICALRMALLACCTKIRYPAPNPALPDSGCPGWSSATEFDLFSELPGQHRLRGSYRSPPRLLGPVFVRPRV